MQTVIIGATKGMGRALARKMIARGDRLFLLGRDTDELQRSAADLDARRPGARTGYATCDLADVSTFGPALEAAYTGMGRIDCVVITAGLFGTQDALEEDLDRAWQVMTVNYANTVVLCEKARRYLMANDGGGRLVVFSSVAGDRGRKPVGIYGSSKAGLSHYLESLDHKYRAQGLVTLTVKPGFVKTGMTEGLKPPPFAGEPDEVADRVIAAIDANKPVVYAPFMWGWVMLVIRNLPRFVMRRVGF
ncbi:MAG: SDR family NAD(P)-dependent oxidoreductase [Alphaproteobacteria bacterium]|nr:SDR family NAD(P)-dependent oxidoreductase [Alphaproteobacteria bacterium]MCB9694289.1 SDR family NAD(P)-dependent oxidoreductase [Alphaproteobacteria bacterium]